VKSTHLKGLIHGALALVAVVEAFNSTTRVRKVLNGAAAGWHTHATIFHFFYEKEMPTWEEGTHGIDEEDYEEEFWDT
jgi:hypothetical protein